MKCAYCGRQKGLFEKFTKYDFCEDCNTKVRADLKSMLTAVDNFLKSYPAASAGVKNVVLQDRVNDHLAIIDELESLRPRVPMFKSSLDQQRRELLSLQANLNGAYTDVAGLIRPSNIEGVPLAYQYKQVNVACVELCNPDFDTIALLDRVSFVQEPENEYDKKAVAVYRESEKLGYLYRGQVQDIVNDWIKHEDPIFSAINSFNRERQTISLFVSLYMDRRVALKSCETTEAVLVKSNEDRQVWIAYAQEGEPLDLEYNDFDETYLVTDSSGHELGEISKSVSRKLFAKEDEFELRAFVAAVSNNSDKRRLKIKVFFKP